MINKSQNKMLTLTRHSKMFGIFRNSKIRNQTLMLARRRTPGRSVGFVGRRIARIAIFHTAKKDQTFGKSFLHVLHVLH